MKYYRSQTLLLLFFLIALTGCGPKEVNSYDNVDQLVEAVKTEVNLISAAELQNMIADSKQLYLVDCREKEEFDSACVTGAVNIPRGLLEETVAMKAPDHRKELVIYCKTGKRAILAAKTLGEFKYSSVYVLEGGFVQWAESFPALVELNPVRGDAKPAVKKPAGGCGG